MDFLLLAVYLKITLPLNKLCQCTIFPFKILDLVDINDTKMNVKRCACSNAHIHTHTHGGHNGKHVTESEPLHERMIFENNLRKEHKPEIIELIL